MYSEIKRIIESRKPDREKLNAIAHVLNAHMPMREFMDMVKAGMGVEVDFEERITGMDAESLMQLIRDSIENPVAYAHLKPQDERALREFVLLNRHQFRFDFGGHFPSRSKDGAACYDIMNPKKQTMSPERVAELGSSLGIASTAETVIKVGSHLQPNQTCTNKDGKAVRLVSQPNLFQWWAEIVGSNPAQYILCECRELTL